MAPSGSLERPNFAHRIADSDRDGGVPQRAKEWHRDGFLISTDAALLDEDALAANLALATWQAPVERAKLRRALQKSLPFALYSTIGKQIGFVRVVSDFSCIAWLGDLYVVENCRGRGLGKWLVETALSYPPLRGVNTWLVETGTEVEFFKRLGFVKCGSKSGMMTRERIRDEADWSYDPLLENRGLAGRSWSFGAEKQLTEFLGSETSC